MIPLPSRPAPVALTVSWATLLKLSALAVLTFFAFKLLPLFGLLFMALLIAMTLSPLANTITRWGGPRWLGIVACALLVFGLLGLFLFVVTPIATAQISALNPAT